MDIRECRSTILDLAILSNSNLPTCQDVHASSFDLPIKIICSIITKEMTENMYFSKRLPERDI